MHNTKYPQPYIELLSHILLNSPTLEGLDTAQQEQQCRVDVHFLDQINTHIDSLNVIIDQYNKTTHSTEQLTLLQKIYQQYTLIQSQYSDKLIVRCVNFYDEIQVKLFNNIKKQLPFFKMTSMQQMNLADQKDAFKTPSAHYLAGVIANITAEQIEKFIFLLESDCSDLSRLFPANTIEYQPFLNFLRTHSIVFLGGKNSRSFKITPKIITKENLPYVLKIEHRKGNPKSAEHHLRQHSLRNVCAKLLIDRPTLLSRKAQKTSYLSLQITEFYSHGDIHSLLYKHIHPEERLCNALTIYSQMAEIIEGIRQDGCTFPDMKNSNWLIDAYNRLYIADTKSLIFSNPEQRENHRRYVLSTRYMRSTALQSQELLDVNALHALMLGKNIYHYLTCCPVDSLKDETNFHATFPIFKTALGQKLYHLIIGLTTLGPEQITVQAAIQQFASFKKLYEHFSKYNKLLNEMALAEIPSFSSYITQRKDQITHYSSLDEFIALQDELALKMDEFVQQQKTTYLAHIADLNFIERIASYEKHIKQAKTRTELTQLFIEIGTILRTHCEEIVKQLGYESRPLLMQNIRNARTMVDLKSLYSKLAQKANEYIAAQKQSLQNELNQLIASGYCVAEVQEIYAATTMNAFQTAMKNFELHKPHLGQSLYHSCNCLITQITNSLIHCPGKTPDDSILSQYKVAVSTRFYCTNIAYCANISALLQIEQTLRECLTAVTGKETQAIQTLITHLHHKAVTERQSHLIATIKTIVTLVNEVPLDEYNQLLSGSSQATKELRDYLNKNKLMPDLNPAHNGITTCIAEKEGTSALTA